MTTDNFLSIARQMVQDYTEEHLDKTDKMFVTYDDVFVVWYAKTLQNSKALLATTLRDGMYYEITYNGDKNEIYLDAYKTTSFRFGVVQCFVDVVQQFKNSKWFKNAKKGETI